MSITKAVITAAARGPRLFPAATTTQKAMLPLFDKNGVTKPLIQIIAEEAIQAGIQDICIVCAPGDQIKYETQFSELRSNLLNTYQNSNWASDLAKRIDNLLNRWTFREQKEPLGYGHAVFCANDFVKDEPFLLLLSDHLYISHHPQLNCAQQLINLYQEHNCSISSVNPVREHLIHRYGTLTGKRVKGLKKVYQIENIAEKPSISKAELELQTTGIRNGYYLCFFGMHILTKGIMQALKANLSNDEHPDRYGLTPVLNEHAQKEKYLALELDGSRHDISSTLGMLKAQIALGLAGDKRDSVLSAITEILAEDKMSQESGN